MTDPKLRVLIAAGKIQARIREMGEQISGDYPTGNLHLICILKGACFFLTDLARAMRRDVFVDFMGISTYGKGKSSSGEVKLTKDLDISLEGADVLVVDDIVDSGIGVPNPGELLGSHCLPEWLTLMRSAYDCIIIDSPPLRWALQVGRDPSDRRRGVQGPRRRRVVIPDLRCFIV